MLIGFYCVALLIWCWLLSSTISTIKLQKYVFCTKYICSCIFDCSIFLLLLLLLLYCDCDALYILVHSFYDYSPPPPCIHHIDLFFLVFFSHSQISKNPQSKHCHFQNLPFLFLILIFIFISTICAFAEFSNIKIKSYLYTISSLNCVYIFREQLESTKDCIIFG